MGRSVDELEARFVAAALTGILAAQRAKPNYKLVCREAVEAGIRVALAVRKDGRRKKLVDEARRA